MSWVLYDAKREKVLFERPTQEDVRYEHKTMDLKSRVKIKRLKDVPKGAIVKWCDFKTTAIVEMDHLKQRQFIEE